MTASIIAHRYGVQSMPLFRCVLHQYSPACAAHTVIERGGMLAVNVHTGMQHEGHAAVCPQQIELAPFGSAVDIDAPRAIRLFLHKVDRDDIGKIPRVHGQGQIVRRSENFIEKRVLIAFTFLQPHTPSFSSDSFTVQAAAGDRPIHRPIPESSVSSPVRWKPCG